MATLETDVHWKACRGEIGEIGNLYEQLMIGKDLDGHGIDPFPTTCLP